jgi:hypothetical protein
MSDIFREVDEDIRREQFKKLWERFGVYILGGAVLIVLVVAGYKFFEYWQESRAAATGDRFVAALELSGEGKHEEAIAALTAIVADGSGGYPTLASFRAAAEKQAAGDDKGAVAEYDTIANGAGSPALIRDMARLRAALILVESATVGDLQTRIGDLAAPGNPWRHTAREILGLAAWRVNDFATARKLFQEIGSDQESSQDVRQRAQLMIALIDARQGAPGEEAQPEG